MVHVYISSMADPPTYGTLAQVHVAAVNGPWLRTVHNCYISLHGISVTPHSQCFLLACPHAVVSYMI